MNTMYTLKKERKKRSDLEILADILKVTMYGAKKSHIVYQANLNFEIVKRYLKRLSEAGLITFSPESNRLIITTLKGRRYLKHYETLTNYMEPA